jgi:type VI secretion system ImpM family protein
MVGPIGFFGKVLSKGDFISSNLPGNFIQPWDNWLRLTLAHCGERLGERARSSFLLSPVWRFVLGPGCAGPQAWAGVIASSSDRIGRIYPLTLAVGLDGESPSIMLMSDWTDGFERLIDLALAMVRDESAVERADTVLQQLLAERPPFVRPPPILPAPTDAMLVPGDSTSVTSAPDGPQFREFCAAAAARAGTPLSLMWQVNWGLPPVSVIGRGLPDTARSATIWEMAETVR